MSLPVKPLTDRTPAGVWLDEQRRAQARGQIMDSPDIRAVRNERGISLFLNQPAGGSSNSKVRQYLLTDASKGDYFICRALSGAAIGATDIYIAKPFPLRQSVFDRDILNEAAPGNIGTEDEITYDFVVESWNGVTFSSTTQRLSYEYKSATFRIATDPDTETTEKQTIIPRFVPAVLIVVDGELMIDLSISISPTIIYAVECTGLGITRPDDPELPEEEQTPIAVNLLALSDGWAWAHTA